MMVILNMGIIMTLLIVSVIVGGFIGVRGLKIDQRGTHFIIAFPHSGTDDNENLLTITAESDVIVYVIMPGSNDTRYSIAAGDSVHVYLPYELTVVSNIVVEKKGVQVIASDKVSVYGFIHQYDGMGGFVALPVEGLSTEYIVVTYFAHNNIGGQLVLVAAEDGTDVQIQMKSSTPLKCNGQLVMNNHVFTVQLQTLGVIRIMCESDITGTHVISNKPVALLSGNPLTQVPQGIQYPDNIVEMMIPTYAYGKSYVLPAVYGRKSGAVYRIVALDRNTVVEESDGTVHTLHENDFVDLDINEMRCLESNRPIMVVQFGKGQDADAEQYEGDPYMAAIPPRERYASRYNLDLYSAWTPPGQTISPYITVFIERNQFPGLSFMEKTSFEAIPGCDMIVAAKIAQSENQTLIHDSGAKFGAVVHGFTNWQGYGYLAGIELDDYSGVDECASRPCQNHGLCYQVGVSFRCYCLPNFSGNLCQNDQIDNCKGNPCANGGTCVDLIRQYKCTCPAHFTGFHCETEITTTTTTEETSASTEAFEALSTESSPDTEDYRPGLRSGYSIAVVRPSVHDVRQTSTHNEIRETIYTTSSSSYTKVETTTDSKSATEDSSTETDNDPTSLETTELTRQPTTSSFTTGDTTETTTKDRSTNKEQHTNLPQSRTQETKTFSVTKVEDMTDQTPAPPTAPAERAFTLQPEAYSTSDDNTIYIPESKSNPCNCTCKNITYKEVEQKAKEIKKDLIVNPEMLSKSRRKFVSIRDNRLSASSIGYLGGAFLTLVFGSIFLVDLSTVLSRWFTSMRDETSVHRASLRDTSIRRKQIVQVRPEGVVLNMKESERDLQEQW